MNFKNLLIITALSLFAFSTSSATEHADDGLRYFVIMAKPSGAVWEMLMDSDIDPEENGRTFLEEHVAGATLIDYYLLAGKPMNMAIVSVPDSRDLAALLYQRMATQLVDEIEIFEVIPGSQFRDVLDAAKALRDVDVYSEED